MLPVWAIIERDLRKYYRSPALMLVSLFLPLLQLLIIGYAFGGQIRGVSLGLVALDVVELFPYVEYIEYLLPGSITLAIFVCTIIGGGLIFIDDKARGFHEGYLVTPISKAQLVMGMLLSGTVKASFAGMVVTLVGSLLSGTARSLTPATLGLSAGFNVLVSFSFISLISLLMVRVTDPLVPRATWGLLNTMLFFPSGAMYPVYSFPTWLQILAAVDPFAYAVHGFRAALLKNVGPSAIAGDIAFLVGFSLACLGGVLLLFPRRL